MAFINEHKIRFGVEPIWAVLTDHGHRDRTRRLFTAARSGVGLRGAVRDQQLKARLIGFGR